jgi:hypothetical protein
MAWERDPVWGTSNNQRYIVNGLATPYELSRCGHMMQRLPQSAHVTVYRACCRQLQSLRPSLSVDKSIRDDRWALTSLSGGVYRSLVGREEAQEG